MISKEHRETPEYVKSGYLYRLTTFIEWPLNAFGLSISPFIVGLYGDDYINKALFSTFRDKRIKGRDWKADYYDNPKKIYHCHLLFIMKIEEVELNELVQEISKKKILTVGDNLPGFCQSGGMINLVGLHPDYGYEINTRSMLSSNITANKEFLELATLIE